MGTEAYSFDLLAENLLHPQRCIGLVSFGTRNNDFNIQTMACTEAEALQPV